MRYRFRTKTQRAGFTLLEVVIAMTIVGMIAANIAMVTRSSSQAYESGASLSALDAQLDRTMDRIALAVMASRRASLLPANSAPLWTPSLTYDQLLGYEDGAAVVGDVERIALVTGPEQIVWTQRPDTPDERRVVWSNWVREYFGVEALNGLDDDLNGLTDEAGLSFTVDGDRVTIRLTLERAGPNNTVIRRTQETTVTCRN
jgi:prepilin-type N-terminal cleavage/methylation domain-containing protein